MVALTLHEERPLLVFARPPKVMWSETSAMDGVGSDLECVWECPVGGDYVYVRYQW